jgi:hypothetical protein
MAPTIFNIRDVLSPMAVHDMGIVKRSASNGVNPAAGVKPPSDINNVGFQVLFAFIGMGMVLTGMWFFFWAKNGGFQFKEDDWEDYKSTVLRRKGPDGKTLSNATKSTRLGGGSVVHGGSYGDAESSVGYTDETGTSVDPNEMREVEEGKSQKFGLRGGDDRQKKREKREKRDHDNNLKDPELRNYRSERPARVGGLNRQADGMYTDYTNTEPSDLGSNVSAMPLVKVKDKKQEAKDKEARARERMRLAKLAEKNKAKFDAAEAKAKKAADKEREKRQKAEQKKTKKTRSEGAPTEGAPSEYAHTEMPETEYAETEYPATEYTRGAPEMIEAPMSKAPISKPSPARRAGPSAAYSFVTGDDNHTVANTAYTGTSYTASRSAPSVNESSYYSDYRPNADPNAFKPRARPSGDRARKSGERRERRTRDSTSQSTSQTQSRRAESSSPRKQNRPRPPPSTVQSESNSDIFTQTNGDVHGTIAYPCHIPGLSSVGSVGVSESVSQVGGPSQRSERKARDVMDGYRRGAGIRTVRRRDSLSDSDS